MAVLLNENFENGTNGATITTGNSAAYNVIGGPTFTDQALEGALAADFNADQAQVMIRWNHAATSLAWYSGYLWLDSLPSTNAYVATFNSGVDKVGDVRINADGTVSVRDNNLAVITSSITLTVGSWHRFALRVAANNQLELRLYIGSNRHGSTPDYSGSGVSTRDMALDNFRFGSTASATIHLRLDRLIIDNATEPTPMVSGSGEAKTNWYLVTGPDTNRQLKSPVIVGSG